MDSSLNDAERLRILRMVEEGKINATEAANMLSELNSPKSKTVENAPVTDEPILPKTVSSPTLPSGDAQTPDGPRWFRVRVTDLVSGRAKVTVNLPVGLVNWGMKIGARYAPEVGDIDFNELSQILKSGADGKLIDVMDEEDGEHVEIFVD